ncbi:hypothetical protein VN97_g929 [Penicillium thymicola]|uniref:Uncharacterized protein n=1 Tax=Penicillium thymicola TaxID=293382 RepID=A0AAI9XCW3_PENTH|nr:hypothetical protein VN97_g929 [Penicillium thymicola]
MPLLPSLHGIPLLSEQETRAKMINYVTILTSLPELFMIPPELKPDGIAVTPSFRLKPAWSHIAEDFDPHRFN